jgi:hypothetical protein
MLDKNSIEIRFKAFMNEFNNHIDLPLPFSMLVQQFIPKVPELLADEDKQADLLSLIQLIGWVIGYKINYEEETPVENIPENLE